MIRAKYWRIEMIWIIFWRENIGFGSLEKSNDWDRIWLGGSINQIFFYPFLKYIRAFFLDEREWSDLDCDLIAAHFAKIVIGLGSVLWQKIVIGSDLANEKKDRLILWIMVVQLIGAATRPPPKKNLLQIFATT